MDPSGKHQLGVATAEVWEVDSSDLSYGTLSPLTTARAYHSVAAAQARGCLYAVGGEDEARR